MEGSCRARCGAPARPMEGSWRRGVPEKLDAERSDCCIAEAICKPTQPRSENFLAISSLMYKPWPDSRVYRMRTSSR